MTGGGKDLKNHYKSYGYFFKIFNSVKIRKILAEKNTGSSVTLINEKLRFERYDRIGGAGSRATKFCFRSDVSNFWSKEEALGTGYDTAKVWLFRKIFREKKLLNAKGAILIEFAVCMPILIILLFYISDLVRIKRYYSQTEFVGQQIANMIQNISQKRRASDLTKLKITCGIYTALPGRVSTLELACF